MIIEKTKLPADVSLSEAVNAMFGQGFGTTEDGVIENLSALQFAAENFLSDSKMIISLERFISNLNLCWIDPYFQISGFEIMPFDRQFYGLKGGRYVTAKFAKHWFKLEKVPYKILKKHHRRPRHLGGTDEIKNVFRGSREKHFSFHVLFRADGVAMSGYEVIKYTGLVYQCMKVIFFDDCGRLLKIGQVIAKIAGVWPSQVSSEEEILRIV